MAKRLTIGADPEFFFKDTRSGEVVSACGLLGGTKTKPQPLEGLPKGMFVQEDNVMAELNIPPTSDVDLFRRVITAGIDRIVSMAQEHNPHLILDTSCSRLFRTEKLNTQQALTFGCDPDYDAYVDDGAVSPAVRPEDLEDEGGQWRFAGGHIHLGYDAKIPPFVVANLADTFLGLSAICSGEQQGLRRKFYGGPGRFRPKPYGIEYRTLSNFWIFNEHLSTVMAEEGMNLVRFLQKTPISELQRMYKEIPWGDIQTSIRDENKAVATQLRQYCMTDLGILERIYNE